MPSIESVIEEEERTGLAWLRILNDAGLSTILAGGAPRDWYRNVQCTDMDFFIKTPCTKEQIEEAIGVEVTALAEERYPTHEFYGYEADIGGHKLQFLVHEYEDAEEFVSSFPVGLSQCWYDLSGSHSTRLFRISHTYKLITILPQEQTNWGYVDKICAKYQGYWPVDSNRILRIIGRGHRCNVTARPSALWGVAPVPQQIDF